MVKFLDLNKQYLKIKKEIDSAINDVITESAFIGGKYVRKFEAEFAEYIGIDYCIGVGNGTDALEIALQSLKLPEKSEVIVPANSFIATGEAVTRAGHKIVFCDCDPYNYTISIDDFQRKINNKTKAVIPVHLYGHPCDMDEIIKISKENDIKVIEDCAQAHGAEYKGKKVGNFGEINIFSFYPSKNLGAYGDGGAIVTKNKDLAKKCRMIANHGRIEKYKHEFEGRNSRLDGLQAAILSVKLKHLDKWNERRIKVANYYLEHLKDIKEIILPKRELWAKQVYHLFVIRSKERKNLQNFLEDNDIQTGIHYPISLPMLSAYKHVNQFEENMIANDLYNELLSIPIGEHLELEDLDYVINKIKEFFN